MARVSVNDSARLDPRLLVASQVLRVNHERLGWRMIGVWSRVTESGTSVLHPRIIAAALGKDQEAVVDALLDAELAEYVDEDALDLSPMRTMFGDFEWYADLAATAHAGGVMRAQTAERHEDGTFAQRDLRSEILECLRVEPRTRKQLRRMLHARKNNVLASVRALLAEGVVVELGDGVLGLADADSLNDRVPAMEPAEPVEPVPAEPVEPVPAEPVEPVPAEPVEPVPVEPAEPSAPAPAPVHAPARVSGARARSHADAHTPARSGVDAPVREAVPEPREPEPISLDSADIVPRVKRRQIGRLLWAYQNRKRAELDANTPSLPLDDTPGGPMDAVLLALARLSPAQCKHVLDVFAVEGTCLATQGRDPLEYLNGRTNWKREQLDRAMATTPEAMRKRFTRRSSNGPPDSTPGNAPHLTRLS